MGALKWGLVHQPMIGEVHIGDDYCIEEHEDYVLVAVADGLGHGKEAHAAASMAVAYICRHADQPPQAILEGVHGHIRGTRGAVVAIARIDRKAETLVYAGLGNIEARIVAEDRVYRPVSVNGIVGHQARKFRHETFPFKVGDLLIMHSDGISDRFEISPMSRTRDPQMLANQLVQSHGRDHDDQLLLIARLEP